MSLNFFLYLFDGWWMFGLSTLGYLWHLIHRLVVLGDLPKRDKLWRLELIWLGFDSRDWFYLQFRKGVGLWSLLMSDA